MSFDAGKAAAINQEKYFTLSTQPEALYIARIENNFLFVKYDYQKERLKKEIIILPNDYEIKMNIKETGKLKF